MFTTIYDMSGRGQGDHVYTERSYCSMGEEGGADDESNTQGLCDYHHSMKFKKREEEK